LYGTDSSTALTLNDIVMEWLRRRRKNAKAALRRP